MRFAGIWTNSMSIAITIYGTVLVACLLGGGVVAWLVALPVLFIVIHLIGIPLVLVCEIAERARLLPKSCRADALEILMLAALFGIGACCLSSWVLHLFGGFLLLMLLLRIAFSSHWEPGEPVELP